MMSQAKVWKLKAACKQIHVAKPKRSRKTQSKHPNAVRGKNADKLPWIIPKRTPVKMMA
jgi:hypothetical protein